MPARMKRPAVTARAAVAAGLFPLLALTACSQAAKPVPPPVTMSFCGGNAQVQPDVVIVVCDTGDITARDLKWTAWGKPAATATGTATVDLCAYNDCHTGSYGTTPIRVIISNIVRCGASGRAYSRLRYVFPAGHTLAGHARQPEYLRLRGRAQADPPPGQPAGQPHLLRRGGTAKPDPLQRRARCGPVQRTSPAGPICAVDSCSAVVCRDSGTENQPQNLNQPR